MDGTTHLTIGALAGAVLLRAAPALVHPLDHSALFAEGIFIGAAAFAALLPDADHPHSLVGRWVPLPAEYQSRGPVAPPRVGRRIPFANVVIWHRGPTHSLLAAGIATVLGALVYWPIALAVLAGYLSHIAVDLTNQSRVQVFWLIRKGKLSWVKPRWPRWRAGSGWDWLMGLVGFAGLFFMAVPLALHGVHVPHVFRAAWKER